MVTVTVPPGATVAGLKLRVALGVDCADVGSMPVKATTPVIEATMMATKAILSIIGLAYLPLFGQIWKGLHLSGAPSIYGVSELAEEVEVYGLYHVVFADGVGSHTE